MFLPKRFEWHLFYGLSIITQVHKRVNSKFILLYNFQKSLTFHVAHTIVQKIESNVQYQLARKGKNMELYEAIKTRKSIRGYKQEAVSKQTIQKILDIAVQSPSAMNTQPWQFYIVGGDILKTIGRENVELLSSGTPPATEVDFTENHKEAYKKRQVELAIQLFQLMEIPKDDQMKRFEWMQRGFRYFDAPAAIILTYDTIMDPPALVHFDLGLVTHAICLAAVEEGLGTCIHGQGAMYPQNIRKHVEIPDTKKIFNCISIGYPDWDFPANKVESTREAAEKMSTWIGL